MNNITNRGWKFHHIHKYIIMWISILLIRFLQHKYKSISTKKQYNQTNRVLNILVLIQNLLYFFKKEFHAWGYFHPDCCWSNGDEKFYRWLFPQKDFKEIDYVVWYNPSAITYYHNKIFTLSGNSSPLYEVEIEKQLKEWNKWN